MPGKWAKTAILAVTDRVGGHLANGSQVVARAILERLEAWFDVHLLVPAGAGSGPRVLEAPESFGAGKGPTLPSVSLIYNFGATAFSCRASEWAARNLPAVPLVNHFQINLACYARHQNLEGAHAYTLTQDQVRLGARATRNLFPSHSELALAAESFGPTGADNYVVPNPFVPEGRPEPERESETFTFFAAGRFSDSVKGADLLYRAFTGLVEKGASARLEIASDSDRFLRMLRGIADDAWMRHGWLPRARLHAKMRAADVVVVPSRYEPFGLVALEALAMGTPVIAMRVGGLQEIVHDGVTGWLSPAGEGSRGLRAAMERALTTGSGALAAMGEAAARVTRHDYSLERIVRIIRTHLDNARHQHADLARSLGAETTLCT